MRKKEKAYSIALTSVFIIFLVFVSSTASASDDSILSDEFSKEGNDIAAYTIDETRLTTNGYSYNPDIYSNKIVYQCSGVWLYDLSTKNVIQIAEDYSDPEMGYELSYSNPVISGNKIAWFETEYTYEEWRGIDVYDLSTKQVTNIAGGGPDYSPSFPNICNDKIVWSQTSYEDGEWKENIYLDDLSTSITTQITTSGKAFNPDTYGNNIVWQDNRNGNWDIYMYDLSTQKETQITTNASDQYEPVIYGDKIVWEDRRNGNSNICMYNLSTKKETQITSSPDDQTSSKIYGNRILWKDVGGEDDGWEYHGIYMCDLSTNQKMKITSGGDGFDFAIYDNRIVWTDNRNGGSDIYMGTLITSPPVAAFSASPTSGKAPLNVTFTDNSIGSPTSWKWTFGDGTNSTEQNPTHRYLAEGNYTVALTATNALGSNTTTKTNYIKVTAVTKPVANFTSNVTSGNAPLNVAFTDKSSGSPTAWNWSFGDGTNSTLQNPIHKYSKAGNYTVVLTASNSAGSNKITKSGYIKVVTKPVANFTSNVTSGNAPLNVAFTDNSKGTPTAWNWSFGDGTNSTQQNPTHKYSKAGNYTVVLTASNSAGSSKITKPGYIKVITKPVANFTSNVTSGYAPLTVSFTDKSSGSPTAWKWSFGDGINSTEQNPMHMYSKAGNYTVVLTANNSAGSSKITKPSYIKVIKR